MALGRVACRSGDPIDLGATRTMRPDIEFAHTQRGVLTLILECTLSGEPLPSLQGIADRLGLKARSNVSRALAKLEEKGFIECERTPHRYIKTRTVKLAKMAQARPVPLLGRIAAGKPILADGDELREFLPLPARHVRGDEVYMLEVRGDSMTGDGIRDGDYIVVAAGPEFKDGDICAVLIDNDEATVKHVYHANGGVRLVSSNPAVGPTFLEEKDYPIIQGKVIGVIRWLPK
jgi:repressor LexA